jgi:hypothetical protein
VRREAVQLIAAGLSALVLATGCGPVHLVASTNIPPPLVVKIPVAVALFIPKDFSDHVHQEERWSTKWNIALGRAQSDALTRLMTAMFERVVTVDSINAGAQLGAQVRAILEPSIEEYAFVTPRDAGSPFFAVSIKYRVNVYSPDGRLADSWSFTGYGTSPAEGLSSTTPLTRATSLAMRDAGAKLAVEFREQAIVRGLLPDAPTADDSSEPAPATESQSAPPIGEVAPPAQPPEAPKSESPRFETPQPEKPKEEKPAGEQAAPAAPLPEVRAIRRL